MITPAVKLNGRERWEISQRFPQLAFLIVHPEVGPILKRAVHKRRPLDGDQVYWLIKETDWYKSSEERSKLYGPEPSATKRPPGQP